MECVLGQACGAESYPSLTSKPRGPGLREAGAEQSRDTLSVLSSVAVNNDRIQGAETVSL